MNTHIRLKTALLPTLVGLSALMQLLDPYQVWMVSLVVTAGLWLISYLWARDLAKNLRIKREIRFGWAQVGDHLEERFTLENRGFAPALWVEVIDQSDMPAYHISRVSDAGSGGRSQWKTKSICSRRGVFTLGPTSLRCGDPFGIYEVSIPNPASATLVVMPPVIPLPKIEVAAGGRSGQGRPRPNAPERTVNASTVREYHPGEDLRWIHWPTTARHQKPYVRVFDSSPAADWWIFLDLQESSQVGIEWDSTLECGIILAASLSSQALRQGKNVGLAVNGDALTWLPPQRSEGQRWKILRSLALANAGQTPLADFLHRNQPSILQQTSLVLITPNVSGEWIQAAIPLLWKGIIPTVLLFDPREFGVNRKPDPILAALAEQSIARHIIHRNILDRPEAHPGHEGEWEWRISATGRAIPLRKPANLNWKVLS